MSVVKLFFLQGRLIGVCSVEISNNKSLDSQPVMGLCSAIQPNHEPLRGSEQIVPDSVTSVVKERRRTKDTEQVAMKNMTTR